MMHRNLAKGRWNKLSLYEQMGNIGTEVGRVLKAKTQDDRVAFNNAVERALELFDLTIADSKRKKQLKEIIRAREVFVDSLNDKTEYNSRLEDIDKYFLSFALAARNNR